MNAKLKSVAAAVLAVASFSSIAANNGVGGYWVNNIVPNAQAVQNTLMQNATGLNYSCGPTSLLFVSNHYARISTGQNSPNMSTVSASKTTIGSIYSYIGVDNNSPSGTSLDQMRLVARSKFGWTQVARMSGTATTSGPSRLTLNMDSLVDYLNRDIPALGVMRGGYYQNPFSIDHIVVIWGYTRNKDEFGRAVFDPNNTRNNDTIHWYEPYYGRQGMVKRAEVTASGTTSAFNIAHFSFLAVGRGRLYWGACSP